MQELGDKRKFEIWFEMQTITMVVYLLYSPRFHHVDNIIIRDTQLHVFLACHLNKGALLAATCENF